MSNLTGICNCAKRGVSPITAASAASAERPSVCVCLFWKFSHGPIWGHIPALSHRREKKSMCLGRWSAYHHTAWGNWIVFIMYAISSGVILAHRTTHCHCKYNRMNCKNSPGHCGEIPGRWYGAFNMRLPGLAAAQLPDTWAADGIRLNVSGKPH